MKRLVPKLSYDNFTALISRIRASGVRVIMPDEADRAVAVDLLMLAHIAAPGWSRTETANRVSVTLPRLPDPIPQLILMAGTAISPWTQLGEAGLKALARLTAQSTISISPEVVETRDVWTLLHENSHILQEVSGGGLVHDLRYVFDREYAVLAAEAPAYACNLMGEDDPEAAARRYADGLRAYGASDAQINDAYELLGVHVRTMADGGCPPVRSLIDGVRFLRECGVENLPALPDSK